jgi:chemotaxis protein methyltransferase CheR
VTDIDRFREIIASTLGLSPTALSDEQLIDVLARRLRAIGCDDVTRYQERLCSAAAIARETAILAELLTVGETYLFREPKQLEALVDVVLPARLRARGGKPLRVLSAGCATGEEAYSLAIAMAERAQVLGAPPSKVVGVDVNPAAIRKAQRARYSAWAFRAAPQGLRERWFADVAGEAEVRREIRQLVTFEERNLLTGDPMFWADGAFDVIFCRNVLIYLSRERMLEVIERFARAITPSGYLFLGYSESLRGLSDDFETMHTNDAFYYRRRDGVGRRAPPPRAPEPPPSARPPPANVDPWLSLSDRLLASRLNDAGDRRTMTPTSAAEGRSAIDAALALLKQERFVEALEALRAAHRDEASPEVRLLVAVLLSHQGKIREAERLCSQGLTGGEADAGARYLLGLCREHAGDALGAARHYRAAIQIDRTFAMPHLRLGRLARREGDMATAWSETRRAAELFEREREGRVMLFGGGFQREALVELCHAELRAYGVRR